MSIIDTQSKNIMVQAMRNVLESRLVQTSGYLSESKIVRGIGFVNESATYEQLLNLTLNPYRETKYLPAHILEGAAAILYSACLTGRNKIGPRAIAEGAAILQKKTGCVVTESMLDAAYNAVKGGGLDVIGESYHLAEAEGEEKGPGFFSKAWGKMKGAGKAVGRGAKKLVGADDYSFWKAHKDVKPGDVANADEIIKMRRKALAKGIGKSAATAAGLAAAGYGTYKLAKWLKNKKKNKNAE